MRTADPRLALLALAAAAAALSGCAEEFPPGSVIENQRILALVAEPPELDGRDPAVAVRVAAVEAAPPETPRPDGLLRSWSFCPFTLGASTAYACAIPQCEVDLPADPDGAVTLKPVELAAACLAAAGGSLPPELAGGTLPETVEVVVRYRLLDPGTGSTAPTVLREAVQRIPAWTVAPTRPLNTAPAFAGPLVFSTASNEQVPAAPCTDPAAPGTAACPKAATLPRGGRVGVVAAVTPDSFETYPVGDRTATEAPAISFFTSAGRFTNERGGPTPAAPTASTELKHEKIVGDPPWVLVWAVVRDLRGGEAAVGPYLLEVVSP